MRSRVEGAAAVATPDAEAGHAPSTILRMVRLPRLRPRRIRPARRRAQHRLSGQDGFTLLEVLVAFSVMAVLLGVLFRGVVLIRASSNAFDDRTHIALIARAILEDALAARTLPDGRSSGNREGRDWTLVAKPVDLSAQLPKPPPDPLLAGTPGASARPRWTPQRLVVSVETGGRPLVIETIRLARAK